MEAMEHKSFQAEVKAFDDATLTITHFISTEKRDRGGDILYAGKNEKGRGMIVDGKIVVLHSHGWHPILGSEPIAKPMSIRVSEFNNFKGIEVKTQFFDGSNLTPPDNTGRRLYEKSKAGMLPNWSVGWMPVVKEFKTDSKGEETRHVYEWILYEYSTVGVPMQPDAQTSDKNRKVDFQFKVIPCICSERCGVDKACQYEQYGELVAWKNEDGTWEEKPYPNEHACRLEDPKKYIRIRRQNDKFGKGIHAIWGVQGGGKPTELQAIRFSKSVFTAAEARKWIKDHDYKCKEFAPASEKCAKCGKEMSVVWEEDVSGAACVKTCDIGFKQICEDCLKKEVILETKRWNKSLSKVFDLEISERPPEAWEYGIYKKFLGCDIKDIFLNSYEIPSPLLGTYLGAIKEVCKKFTLLDTRNFSSDGNESPPIREVIRLSSSKSDDFLVCGIQFYKYNDIPFVLKYSPYWSGLKLRIITSQEQNKFNKDLLDEIHGWVKTNNFLKGEKFTLYGEFLDKTEDDWDGLVLEDETKIIVRNSINQINKKKSEMNSRGLLFVGRPGTGKTKTGRTIMNKCDSTFLWVSSRDFRYGSPHGIISLAFSLAKDLSPSVLFLEDIDTWLGSYLTDLLKTELDGLKQNKGIITILTSNNPETLPEALLDRPGRFHHVLDFKLPEAKHRRFMLKLWIEEEVNEKVINEMVTKTEGFSGAHLKELVDFAKIISEENSIGIEAAIYESLKRLMKQRELIDDIRQNKKSYALPNLLVVEQKSVIPYQKTALAKEDEPWNSVEESKKADLEGLKNMAVWFDVKKPDCRLCYKGIHHRFDRDYSCVWNGVRALATSLMNVQGKIKIPAQDLKLAREHCEAHYKDFGKGDPPWKKKEGEEFIQKVEGHKAKWIASLFSEEDRKELHEIAKKLIPDLVEFFNPAYKQDDWDNTYDGVEIEYPLTEDEDVAFKLVDGDTIRQDQEVDFRMGGHHYSYDFIPENEIWIDKRMMDEDIICTKACQVTERELMKYYGVEYNAAHEIAGMVEEVMRHIVSDEEYGGHAGNGNDNRHYFVHGGDHHHDHGVLVSHDWEKEVIIVSSAPLTKEVIEEISRTVETGDLKVIEEIVKKNGLQITRIASKKTGLDLIPKPTATLPEGRKVTVVSGEEKPKKVIEEMMTDLITQITEAIKKVGPALVKEEIDRQRGRVK